jgi:hypothetical protein
MAFTPNKYLKTRSPMSFVYLRDQRHASRLFADDSFRLAPKFSHLFHVSFSINPSALKSIDLLQRHRNEINMLVKSITLPKFTISAETANQYNRKKVIQFQHKFENATIKFHDDNMGLINQVWQNYYSYYYADPTSAKNGTAYNRNATKNFDFVTTPFGLDNGSNIPFFNHITIYQMARHEFVSYKLHNPLIASWDHAGLEYNGQAKLHDNTMTIAFEAVSYGAGTVSPETVEGFGFEHYDVTPSPIEGIADSNNLSPSFVSQQNVTRNSAETLNNVVESVNTYQNTQEKTNQGTPGLLVTNPTQTVGGIQGITFPVKTTGSGNVTEAKKVNLG